MNVLVIGSSNNLINRLISIFNKEGHRVSVLTGSYHTKQKYSSVFERYNFPYTSNNLTEIFASVSPDLTICTGIYDGNFTWKNIQQDSVEYVSSVLNILVAFSVMNKGRLVYLSSDEIYKYNHLEKIREDKEPDAGDLRGMTLIEAENLCGKFRKGFGADIITIRLSGYYHKPERPEDIEDIVSKMCLEALKTGTVDINTNRDLMLIHESDAAYFISKTALSDFHEYPVYNISSGKTVSEQELKSIVLSEARKQLDGRSFADEPEEENIYSPYDENGSSVHMHSILDVERFTREFGINKTADIREKVSEIIAHMLVNEDIFLTGGRKKVSFINRLRQNTGWLFKMIVPYLENLAVFVLAFFLTLWTDGSSIFAHLDLFLIYVILFAVFYGQSQAAFSAILSVLGMLIPKIIQGTGGEALLDIGTYVWIAQLFVIGLGVGYLRDRLNEQKDEAMEDHEYMARQIEDIRDINGSNSRIKNALQAQLINHNESIGTIYDITSKMESYHSVDVLFQGTEVIMKVMGSNDIAVYVVYEDSPYARMFTATSGIARQLGNSFRLDQQGEMSDAFRDRETYINKTWDKKYPMLARAVYEGDAIRFIIMIWTLPVEKLTLGQANLLTIVCRLTKDSVLRARHYYMEIQQDQHYGETSVLLREPFRRLVDMFDWAEEHRLTEFIILRVYYTDGGLLDTAERLESLVRPNDYRGMGLREDAIYVIITNTSVTDAEMIIDRLAENGIRAVIAEHELI